MYSLGLGSLWSVGLCTPSSLCWSPFVGKRTFDSSCEDEDKILGEVRNYASLTMANYASLAINSFLKSVTSLALV